MDPSKNNKQWRHRVKVSLDEGHVPIKLGLISNMTYLPWLFLVNISFFYTHIKPRLGLKVKVRAGFRVINKDTDSFPPGYNGLPPRYNGLHVTHVKSDSKVVSLSPTTGIYLGGSSSFSEKLREFNL